MNWVWGRCQDCIGCIYIRGDCFDPYYLFPFDRTWHIEVASIRMSRIFNFTVGIVAIELAQVAHHSLVLRIIFVEFLYRHMATNSTGHTVVLLAYSMSRDLSVPLCPFLTLNDYFFPPFFFPATTLKAELVSSLIA